MRWLAILVATIAVLSSAGAQQKGELHLFVPCGMIVPFQRLKTEFERQTGIKLRITYDNGVMLVRRIREKGERPRHLGCAGRIGNSTTAAEGFIDPKSVVTFGTFKLILVVPARNRAGIQSLKRFAQAVGAAHCHC
jgi:ABC-type molybdate transport system substrate-binding protein